MTIRLIYRRNPTILARRVDGQRSEYSETLRSAPYEDEESEAGTAPAANSRRWLSGAMESLVLILVRLASVAVALAVWRIASDLGLFYGFLFSTGVLSHWQVWFALGVLLSGTALTLSRRLQLAHANGAARTNQAQAA